MVRTKHFDERIKNREIYITRAGQNWQLILPIVYKEPCGYLNEVVYICRIVDNSHSHRVKSKRDLIKRCNEHKDILFNVIKTIPMKKSIRFMYKIRIAFKYLKKKFRIII